MDYYEEFGIPRSATPDQIRHAHKCFVRLLHPDQFQDPEIKGLAEAQLKRINEIAGVLSDPDRRRGYDSPVRVQPGASRYREHAGWGVALAVLVAWVSSTLLTFPQRQPNPLPAVALTSTPERAAPPSKPPQVRNRPRSAPPQRRRSAEQVPRTEELLQPARLGEDLPSFEQPQLLKPAPITPVTAYATLPPPEPRPKGFTGRWLYPKPSVPPAAGLLYPPEYIETVIALESGMLRGRYRARYLVTDRAISPEVLFRFEGAPGPDSVSLAWVGDGGARGEVQLRLVSDDSLEVRWIATEMGKHLGLASGTAVLVRRHEP